MTTKSEKMAIWKAVAETNPAHTKHVGQRGGFTAIDAQYQIQMATEQFGAVGIGWGYDVGEPKFTETLILIPVTLWHSDRLNTFGPQYGCAEISGKRVDADAPKKATTDAITKLLSHLGFNADVFMGRFDDNKYVAQMEAKFSDFPKGPAKNRTHLKELAKAFGVQIKKATDGFELNEQINKNEAMLGQLEKDLPQWWLGDGGDSIGLKKTIENLQEQFEKEPAK